MDFNGKRALVLGGSSGIGESVVRALVDRGAHVICSSRTKRNTPRNAERQGRYYFVRADARDALQVKEVVRQAEELLGGLDLVVHSIGGGCSGSLLELQQDAWLNAFDIHVHSVMYLARAIVPLMCQSGGGAFLLVSSAAAYRAPSDAIGYSTAKAAQIQLARCMANGLAKENIRVNCVSPGFISTPFHETTSATLLENLVNERIPLQRIGQAEEVADLLLAVAANRYLTGQSIVIDGGLNLNWR
ncbi:MAG: SDR family NAD(P)-dependent oxidoreductase [Algiphilus sp.]